MNIEIKYERMIIMKKLLITAILAGLTAANVIADECAMCPKKQPRQAKAAQSCCDGENAGEQAKKTRSRRDFSKAPAVNQQDALMRAIMNPKIAGELSLSDEQMAKLKEICNSQRSTNKELQAKIRDLCEKQCALIVDENSTEEQVVAAVEDLWNARKELAVAQTKNLLGVRQLLNPEQIAKANELMKEMRKKPVGKDARKHPKIKRPTSEKADKRDRKEECCDGNQD